LQAQLKELLKRPLLPKGSAAMKYLQMTNTLGNLTNPNKNAIEQIELQKDKVPKKLRFKTK
jgi:hypothetical protein